MTLERALYSYLSGHTAVSALLGTRIYPEMAPTERIKEFPYATYSQSGELPVHHMTGFAGLTDARITLEVWCDASPQRDALAAALQTAINAWAPDSREQVAIRRAVVMEQIDTYIPPTDGSERGVYQRALDLDIWYKDL